MRYSRALPITVSAPPMEMGATNMRTRVFQSGLAGAYAMILAAQAGDTIAVSPGVYGPIAVNLSKSITIKSSIPGTKFVFDAGNNVGWRVFDLALNVSLTLEDCEARNNRAEYGYASGIWPGGGTYSLIIRRCLFHDLNNGILVGPHNATVLVEDSEFYDCGDGGGQGHNIYVGNIPSFTMRGCWSHMTNTPDYSKGHLVKSRARVTLIEGNRLTMEQGHANRPIDCPNGGDVTVRGNLLEINAGNDNTLSQGIRYGQFLSFGVEEWTNFAAHWPVNKLNFEQNTCVNRNGSAIHFAKLETQLDGGITWSVKDNVIAGLVKHPSVAGFPNSYIHQVQNGYTNAATGAAYEISEADNTFISVSELAAKMPGHAAFDFRLATPVAGSKNWAARAYKHPRTSVARTDSFRGAVAA